MSKYTTELRYICEEQAGKSESVDYNSISEVIAAARPKIFNFNYPYYSEDQKQRTEENILRHFYTMEIGEETYGLWKLRLEDRMNQIMPYYVGLFKSAAMEYDPLIDVDLKETLDEDTTAHNDSSNSNTSSGSQNDITSSQTVTDEDSSNEASRSGQSTSNRTSEDITKNKYSDTPQGSIQNLENDTYLTNASINSSNASDETIDTSSDSNSGSTSRDINVVGSGALNRDTASESSGESTSNDSGTRDYLKITKGKTAGKSYSELINAYRSTLLRIDSMICDELNDLFMLIW